MASAAGVAGVRATLDLGSKSSKCVQCGEPDSARITHQPEVGHGGQVDGKHAKPRSARRVDSSQLRCRLPVPDPAVNVRSVRVGDDSPKASIDAGRLNSDGTGFRAESGSPHWTHLELLLPKSSVARTPATPAADAIAYTQTTCSTGATPTPQSSAANTMDKPCSPTWQAFTPTQPHKPGNKN